MIIIEQRGTERSAKKVKCPCRSLDIKWSTGTGKKCKSKGPGLTLTCGPWLRIVPLLFLLCPVDPTAVLSNIGTESLKKYKIEKKDNDAIFAGVCTKQACSLSSREYDQCNVCIMPIKLLLLLWFFVHCIDIVKVNINIITSFCFLSDGELWPDQELPGPGGDIHYSDDDTVSHRGEKSHHRTVQLRPWDDAWSQVTETHTGM